MINDNINQTKIMIKKKYSKLQRVSIQACISIGLFFILILILFLVLRILNNKKDKILNRIDSLTRQNNKTISEIRSIEKKSTIAKTYIKVWNEEFTDKHKLLKGINYPEVEKQILNIASANHFINTIITSSPTIMVGGAFEKEILNTYTVLITMQFSCITDLDIYNFLDALKSNLDYFIVIESLSFTRVGKVDNEFLKTLKNGNNVSGVNGEIKIRLYGLGLKGF